MPEQTRFERECYDRGWSLSTTFLAAFARTAQEIGEEVTVTGRQLRRWKQPDPPRPRAAAWRTLHAMFGTSPADRGFPQPPAGLPGYDSSHGIERRALLSGALGTAVGATFTTDSAVGTAHLNELREGLRSLFALDNAYGSADVRPLAVRHLARVRRVINTGTYPDSIGRQLHLLAGETAEHCGWLAYDAGAQNDASRYWGDALTSATMLGDDSLQILVMASMSLQAVHVDRPRDGLELARAARRKAKALGSTALESLLATREARALAAIRDAPEARRALADAMRLTERAAKGRPGPAWVDFHGRAELDFAQGLLFTDLGHHRAAIPYLQAALSHQESQYGRNRALYRLTLARGLVRAGEADKGAAEAVDSLGHLAEVQSGRVLHRLAEVRDLLAETGSAGVREPVEVLSHHIQEAESTR